MKILFVCLGNICRSAAAEAVMSKLLDICNIHDWVVDSAGTSAYHQGEQADPRTLSAMEGQRPRRIVPGRRG